MYCYTETTVSNPPSRISQIKLRHPSLKTSLLKVRKSIICEFLYYHRKISDFFFFTYFVTKGHVLQKKITYFYVILIYIA